MNEAWKEFLRSLDSSEMIGEGLVANFGNLEHLDENQVHVLAGILSHLVLGRPEKTADLIKILFSNLPSLDQYSATRKKMTKGGYENSQEYIEKLSTSLGKGYVTDYYQIIKPLIDAIQRQEQKQAYETAQRKLEIS